MSDYGTDSERFRRKQEQAERHGKHLENLKILSQHCHVPVDKVMAFIRPKVKLKKIIRLDGPLAGQTVASSTEFGDAPQRLTDPELAEWAVQKISNRDTTGDPAV